MDLKIIPWLSRLESVAFGQAELAPVALIQEKSVLRWCFRYRFGGLGGGFKYLLFSPLL